MCEFVPRAQVDIPRGNIQVTEFTKNIVHTHRQRVTLLCSSAYWLVIENFRHSAIIFLEVVFSEFALKAL